MSAEITGEIRRTLDLLLEPGMLAELRVLGAEERWRARVLSGYYSDRRALARDAANWSGRAENVTVTLNPVNPQLRARAPDRLAPPKHATTDDDILVRRRLLVDIDPRRAAGISSTAAEHEAALACGRAIRKRLDAGGWPAPLFADSGNGAHLVFAIDLPNDSAATALVKRALEALAAEFDDDRVAIDCGTFNPARLVKIYGTLAKKGVSTADRPHRFSRIIETPARLVPVHRELLERLAAEAPPENGARVELGQRGAEIAASLAALGHKVTKHKRWKADGLLLELETCPWNASHRRKASVLARDNGALSVRCLAASCAGQSWVDLPAELRAAVARALGAARHADASAGAGADGPSIDASDHDLLRMSGEAWDAIKAANANSPVLFRNGNVIVRLESTDGAAPTLRRVDQDRLRYHVARLARWGQATRGGGWQPAPPPELVLRDMLAHPDPPLPQLERVVGAPVFAQDGQLLSRPGYHERGRLYFDSRGLDLPEVAEAPTPAEVKRARDLLVDDLLCDFPLTGAAERAHAISLLLEPFVRAMIPGPTPMYLIEKPETGTGATLLASVLLRPALGGDPPLMGEGRDEAEMGKLLTAKLVEGASVVVIDNATWLKSSDLARALTAGIWEGRTLGRSEMVRVPVRCTWAATANNALLSRDIARRTVRIRLDAKRDRPWLGRRFKHQLPAWAEEHRSELVWAALTLVRAWIAAGRPEGRAELGMFEAWAHTMGGILKIAGMPSFLENAEELYEVADTEGAQIHSFVHAWWRLHRSTEVGVADLYRIATSDDVNLELKGRTEQGQRTWLGRQLLPRLRDRRFNVSDESGEPRSLRVAAAGTYQGAARWQLESSSPADDEIAGGMSPSSRGSPSSPTPGNPATSTVNCSAPGSPASSPGSPEGIPEPTCHGDPVNLVNQKPGSPASWPESLADAGEKRITPLKKCACGASTWVSYGDTPLCLICARRPGQLLNPQSNGQ